ncbi:MAG: VOC family protein [Oscillospiraceae bacterium]
MTIGEVSLETNDVVRLANFYRALLGLEAGPDTDDPVHQVLIAEGTGLTVYNNGTPKSGENDRIALAFTVDDVDAEYVRLLAMGVTVLEPPTTRPWGARNMQFLDLDGNHIYFRSLQKE